MPKAKPDLRVIVGFIQDEDYGRACLYSDCDSLQDGVTVEELREIKAKVTREQFVKYVKQLLFSPHNI